MLGCQLSDTETRTTLWRPQCFNKKIALLGTFCVAATTDDDDKDPNHKLPRITFEVRSYPISHLIRNMRKKKNNKTQNNNNKKTKETTKRKNNNNHKHNIFC